MNYLRIAILGTLLLALSSGCATPNASVTTDLEVRNHPEQYLVLAVHNEVESVASHPGSTTRGYGTGVSYTQSARARALLNAIAKDYHLQAVAGWPIQVLAMQCVIFKSPDNAMPATLMQQLQQDSRVMIAQPLQTFATNSNDSDNAHNDSYASLQQSMSRMDVTAAHRWSRGQGVRIAVIDTGMDGHHPGLQGRVGTQKNFVDTDNTQFFRDRHGTAVAGVIAANANNHTGIIGVAPEATVIALKACWQLQADRDDARCNSFTLAQALASAIELHAQIINLSVIGPNDPLLTALVEQAQAAGIIVVGAADSTNNASFPAHIPNVIGVMAMEQASPDSRLLYAPGRDVLTLTPGGHYDFSSGSSIATAEVSGTVALLLARHETGNTLSAERLRQLLTQSTEVNATDKMSSVNACRALAQLLKQSGCDTDSAAIAHNTSTAQMTQH